MARLFASLLTSFHVLSSLAALNITLPLFDIDHDAQYGIPLGLGTPQQGPGLYLLDSGSSVFWALSCDKCVDAGGQRTVFHPKNSKTFVSKTTPWGINYQGGLAASGYISQDTVHFGNDGAAQKAEVLVGSEVSLISAFKPGISGVFGLGDPGNIFGVFPSSVTTYSPPWATLFSTHTLAPLIGILPGRSTTNATTVTGSITFGAVSPKYEHSLSWFQSKADSEDSTWLINGVGMEINGKLATGANFSAAIDTGTTNAVVDADTAKAVLGTIPGFKIVPQDIGGGRTFDNYLIPCNASGQTISFVAGATRLTIDSSTLPFPIFNTTGLNPADIKGLCSSRVSANSFEWLIGNVFLKHAYIALEYTETKGAYTQKRLGLAAA
ncbi:acid protease [Rickenella mellea]|uniref:Acid protease n=1 Tax=Rickenella mellea TaxID=50990 RepID=A0A4Y7PSC1_9AGAM|nr:acid protease [Rickenella mellea]